IGTGYRVRSRLPSAAGRRGMTEPHLDPVPSDELDPVVFAARRRERDRVFNVVVVPRLRALGFMLLALVVVVHNTLVLPPFSAPAFARFGLSLAVYSALSALA